VSEILKQPRSDSIRVDPDLCVTRTVTSWTPTPLSEVGVNVDLTENGKDGSYIMCPTLQHAPLFQHPKEIS
jgi:hypothetical protein